jgi:hypothetical protein
VCGTVGFISQALILTTNLGRSLNAANAVGKLCWAIAILFRTHRNQNGHYRPVTFDNWSMRGSIAKIHWSPHLLWTDCLGSCTRPLHMPVSAAKLPTTDEAIHDLASGEDAVALNALADAAAVNDQF